ncbi:hypothetical protein SAMN05216412_101414 [Nitrosospira multiformis]|uniref:Uncharacterized protein n=2 Tax=Nitrosospira multiformis TaxID=1231 RepID=A0A1H9YWI4_9PROT|nr:hypothetical protein SAMN05216412_101414 [Nitrosospira multiformis]
MSFDTRLKYLRIALNLFGFFFLIVLAPLMLGLWPSGWTWGVDQGHSHYALMIIAMYAVLRGFLLLAARRLNPGSRGRIPVSGLSRIRQFALSQQCVKRTLQHRAEGQIHHLQPVQ